MYFVDVNSLSFSYFFFCDTYVDATALLFIFTLFDPKAYLLLFANAALSFFFIILFRFSVFRNYFFVSMVKFQSAIV